MCERRRVVRREGRPHTMANGLYASRLTRSRWQHSAREACKTRDVKAKV